MPKLVRTLCAMLILTALTSLACATPATQVLGRDFTFPNAIPGMPHRLSDFSGLHINSFTTNDGVKLSYREAGQSSR